MADVRTATQEFQGQILDTIRKSQEAVTDAIRTWAETVQSVTPSLPIPSVPLADKLPRPGELVSNAYDFAEQLLAAQRKFAELTSLSNPYLSQVERGMHQPSVRVLKLIAEALNISAETLLIQAGLLDAQEPGADGPAAEEVAAAIRADHRLTGEQQAALIAVYDSMLNADRGRDH